MKRYFIGIDPGQSGGIGVLNEELGYEAAMPMPIMQLAPSLKVVDGKSLGEFLKPYTDPRFARGCQCIIEQVSAMPGQGVTSMFGFGVGFGGLLMFLQGYNIPFQLVSPAKWKRAEGLTKDKELSLGKARSLWPGAPLTRKKDDGVAEALLMAHWLARNYLTKNTE